ncbi:unnamed protein product [Leptidea sinapis]|uniref:Clu domain-containing protein n=1 Tax=Leptidea sinapis TaxID=189913 RepID=A0A5E4PWG3_9NEOP|nr:unnamed protein product [Leptidea sinapis]
MALGSEVNNTNASKLSSNVKKSTISSNVSSKSVTDNVSKEKLDKPKTKMNKESGSAVSNGHASAPNGRADDEGGGNGSALPRVSYAAAAKKALPTPANNVPTQFHANSECQKIENDCDKSTVQGQSGNTILSNVNGDSSISNNNNYKKSKLGTKEPITNGAEAIEVIVVNSDPLENTECDISSNDNTKLVSNGIDSDMHVKKDEETGKNGVLNSKRNPIKNKENVSKKKENKKAVSIDKSEDKNNTSNKCDTNDKQETNGPIKEESKSEETSGDSEKVVNGDKERESSPSEDGDEKKGDAEVVFIQDMGFTVKIVSPGAEPLDIQVSSMELVQEIHQVLMDREDTCHRTCFSLQLDGVTLDNFAELKNIEGLKEGSVIKVVEEPYTMREARIHVRHVRDLLKSIDYVDAYAGQECSSLAFLNIVTQGDILEKKKSRPESVDCTPPDYIMPGSTERPLLPLHPGLTKENKAPQCLKVLTTSGWNPPPGPRKMCGDLLYLHILTLEDRHFHITACPRGFYLNQSTEEVFNPRPSTPSLLCHSLIELLSIVSPAFKRNFAMVQKRRMQKHPFERVATPYQLYQWASPMLEHTVDAIRAEDTFSSKLGYEEHIPGQTRDWNEELQTTRELPRSTLPERLLRERAIFKVHSDFVAAATRGAMAVVDGNVMAINPGEEPKMQMFIWNNIFFSLGFDVRDHYKDLGGDAAAFVAPRNDLQGVRVYSAVDTAGLHTLGTVVVDYRGYRVTAQSIIPGILEKEQEQSVVYGSIDFGNTVLSHPKYMQLLSAKRQNKATEQKSIEANKESDKKDTAKETEKDKKDNKSQEKETKDKEAKKKDKVAKEKEKEEKSDAKDEKSEAKEANKIETVKESDELLLDENLSEIDTDVAKKIVESITDSICNGDKQENDSGDRSRAVVAAAARAVASLKESEFDVRFNPDVYSAGIKHAAEPEQLAKQRHLVKEAAAFLLTTQIPAFVRECLEHTSAPMDGAGLTEALHARGINVRYLGRVVSALRQHASLSYLHAIANPLDFDQSKIRLRSESYWGYELNADSMDTVIEKHGLQKISLLRSFAIKVGLQILLREYDFDSKNKATFSAGDIMNIFPVVKHINPRASDAYNFYTTGQNKIQSGAVSEGHELIAEALNLLNNVYGAMHGEIAQCLRMVARLCYVTGEHRGAMTYQQKAVLMSERVNGIDHPYTITEYSHLALYCFANGQVSTALKLLYRARYLALLVCGENHPEMALLDYELSLRFAERALAVTSSTHGPRSLKAAVARHLLARTLSCLADFRTALAHEKETYTIYKTLLGEKHEKTRESSECLRHLTQQAVVVQKRLAEAYAKSPAPLPPPIHVQPPAMASVIDMLNLINGILFVQISPQDIEQFKAEIEKRQKDLPIPGVLQELAEKCEGEGKEKAAES